jgi:hypothetical protein
MNTLKLRLKSAGPAMMNSERLANPLDPLKLELDKLTAKRKKTPEEQLEILRLKYRGSLYWDRELGPYWPGSNVLASLRNGARLSRQGKQIERGVLVAEDKLPLRYKGPRTPDELFATPEFVDIRSAVLQSKRIMACRPIFHEWAADVTLMFDDKEIDRDVLSHLAEVAGYRARIGTYRAAFGRYSVEGID